MLSLRIGHDNSGLGGAWFLGWVEIENFDGSKWSFPHNRWLALDEDDGKLEHEIFAEAV